MNQTKNSEASNVPEMTYEAKMAVFLLSTVSDEDVEALRNNTYNNDANDEYDGYILFVGDTIEDNDWSCYSESLYAIAQWCCDHNYQWLRFAA